MHGGQRKWRRQRRRGWVVLVAAVDYSRLDMDAALRVRNEREAGTGNSASG
jgi:hypothetical protein